jgi:hypothetical protein
VIRAGSPRQGGARDSREQPSHCRPFGYKYRTLLQMTTAARGRGLTGTHIDEVGRVRRLLLVSGWQA